MSARPSLQLRQRRVLPLVLMLVLVLVLGYVSPASGEDPGCFDRERGVTRATGEQWLLPDCGGVATCGWSGSVYTFSCPELPGCRRVSDGNSSAVFPRCCPKYECDGCRSEQLGRSFGPGDVWTEKPCVRASCRLSPAGGLHFYRETCKPLDLGLPPSFDCELVEQDAERGEYPLCCAHYRCPGLCRAGGEWVPSAGLERADSCKLPSAPTAQGWNFLFF